MFLFTVLEIAMVGMTDTLWVRGIMDTQQKPIACNIGREILEGEVKPDMSDMCSPGSIFGVQIEILKCKGFSFEFLMTSLIRKFCL